MPLYEYVCPRCNAAFEKLQAIAQAGAADCPNCEAPANRIVSLMAPAQVAGGSVGIGGCACGGNCACR